MTVAALPSVAEYLEDGVTTSFPAPFRFKSSSDLVVERILDSALITLAIGVDYTVAGGETDAGGTVTRTAATNGAKLRIRRQTARAQPMVYTTGDRFPAVSHEEALDRQMLIAQEQAADIGDLDSRALTVPPGEVAPTLPPLAQRIGGAKKVLAVNQDTGALGVEPIGEVFRGNAGPSNNTRFTRTAIEAAAKSDKTSLYDNDLWVFQDGDYSAKVATDTYGGIFIAGTADLTGATGAWVRSYKGGAKPEWFGAKRDAGWAAGVATGTDDTAAIQRALRVAGWVELQEGAYRVDAIVGIRLRTGMRITGAGRWKSFLIAGAGGGTLAQLEALERGSVIRRDDFDRYATVPGENPYVTGAYLADFGVILTHPAESVTADAIQVGVDLRHIRDPICDRVYVGNFVPPSAPFTRAVNGSYDMQGYGFVFGTLSVSDPAYSGGEGGALNQCFAWNLYRNVVLDDTDLSPASASYSVSVESCDIQGGHNLLSQFGQYGAQSKWFGNRLQNVVKQPGNVIPSSVYRIEGFEIAILPGAYIEAGSGADFLLFLQDTSKRNAIVMGGYSATSGGGFSDTGNFNTIDLNLNGGLYPGGNDSSGPPQRMFNRVLSPGTQLPVTVIQGQHLGTNATSAVILGNGAVVTQVTLQNGRYLGQHLLLFGNSFGVRFATAAAVWSNEGPPEIGGGDQQVASVSLMWTTSGWVETARSYRTSTRRSVRISGTEQAFWDTAGLNLAAGKVLKVAGVKVVGAQQPAISDAGSTDAKVAAILSGLRAHGLIAS